MKQGNKQEEELWILCMGKWKCNLFWLFNNQILLQSDVITEVSILIKQNEYVCCQGGLLVRI